MRSGLITRFLVAALVGLAAWGWLQHRQLHALEAQLAASAAALSAAQERAEAAEARLAVHPGSPGLIAVASAEGDTLPTAPGGAPPPAPDFPARVLDDPALQGVLAAAARGALDERYGPLFRKLQLDPQRLGRLKQLLTERQLTTLDAVRAAQAQGLPPAEIDTLLDTAGEDIDANIRLLLGEPGYEQFQDHRKNGSAHALLDQFEQRIGTSTTPLSEAQAEALRGVIASTTELASSAGGAAADPLSKVMLDLGAGPTATSALRQPRITDQMIQAAQPHLNEGQVEVLRQLQAEQQAQLDAAPDK